MSKQRLAKLTADGNEIISNIRIAADARESLRRVDEDELRRQRIDKIEAERKACTDKMAEITRKWDSALQKEIPEDLRKVSYSRMSTIYFKFYLQIDARTTNGSMQCSY